jgi:hypothetical protein
MKYRIVQVLQINGKREWLVTDVDDIVAAMEIRNAPVERMTRLDGPAREELRGLPVFKGFAGPSWGGIEDGETIVRYEDWNAYNILST